MRPRWTVRLRLTLLYGGLFLVSGAALLAFTYVLFRHSTVDLVFLRKGGGPPGLTGPGEVRPVLPEGVPDPQRLRDAAIDLREDQLQQLLVQSGIALAVMALVSVALGWLVAGRVLKPLRTMAATTRRISHENLHQRLALAGPRDELKDLADTIDQLLERLEAAFDAQRRFVAKASHELRTPLAMMRTSLDVATAKPAPVPAQVNDLDGKLREGLDHADRLLEAFLVLSRAQHGRLANEETVALPEIVAEAVDARRDAIAAGDLRLRTALADVQVRGSRTLLARMAENVVDNAIRHNERGGSIEIGTEVDGETARVVVESGGGRLDEREVEQLAQPFRRLGPERTGSDGGVGLGLSIVSAIAAAHGGRIELHARPEGGLRVEIALPLAPREERHA
jgi:signal transduction histidine kinase